MFTPSIEASDDEEPHGCRQNGVERFFIVTVNPPIRRRSFETTAI
jgi:hypothetical protein